MSLLKEILLWFIYGQNGQETVPQQKNTGNGTSPHRDNSDELDFDLNKGANVRRFLEDLRSIQPLSKQFSRAREDLLQELKKLSPPKDRSQFYIRF